MAAYDTLALVASVKRRASVPTTQALISTQDILDIANEEMQGYVVPCLLAERSEYLVATVNYKLPDTSGSYTDAGLLDALLDMPLVGDPLVADGLFFGNATDRIAFRLPERAIGSKLRALQLIDTKGMPWVYPNIGMDQIPSSNWGYWIAGNIVTMWNNNLPLAQTWYAARVSYYQRPNTLILPSACGVVRSYDFDAKTVTLSATPPATFTTSATFDVVKAKPGFECLSSDQTVTLVAGSTLTFENALPDNIAAGDYVCLATEAPVAQVPVEFHPLLQQATAVKVLQTISDYEALERATVLLGRMESDAKALVAQRVDGAPAQVINRSGLLRQWF